MSHFLKNQKEDFFIHGINSPKQSEQIQRLLFAAGFSWLAGGATALCTSKRTLHVDLADNRISHSDHTPYTARFWTIGRNCPISAKDFLNPTKLVSQRRTK